MSAAISAISQLASSGNAAIGSIGAQPENLKPASPFSDLLTSAIGDVDHLQSDAQSAVTGLMSGSGVDVHTAMIATEKASMAFELTLAVRNKAAQAYQQVMSMQF
jgi:flagellar hook-basal body complex protein FliE